MSSFNKDDKSDKNYINYDTTFITSPAIAYIDRVSIKELQHILTYKKLYAATKDITIDMDSATMREYIESKLRDKKREAKDGRET